MSIITNILKFVEIGLPGDPGYRGAIGFEGPKGFKGNFFKLICTIIGIFVILVVFKILKTLTIGYLIKYA